MRGDAASHARRQLSSRRYSLGSSLINASCWSSASGRGGDAEADGAAVRLDRTSTSRPDSSDGPRRLAVDPAERDRRSPCDEPSRSGAPATWSCSRPALRRRRAGQRGDRVVSRWTLTGTHRGRRVRLWGIVTSRFQEGTIAEDWAAGDTLTLAQQLGLWRSLRLAVKHRKLLRNA
jgi:hypothetical protein